MAKPEATAGAKGHGGVALRRGSRFVATGGTAIAGRLEAPMATDATGSHHDTAGTIRKAPTPGNPRLSDDEFLNDHSVQIG